MSRKKNEKYFIFLIMLVSMFTPIWAFASVESSLMSLQSKLTGVILPSLSVVGIGFAAFSFLSGNENASKHIKYAAIGTAIGFGAQSIVTFISGMVH